MIHKKPASAAPVQPDFAIALSNVLVNEWSCGGTVVVKGTVARHVGTICVHAHPRERNLDTRRNLKRFRKNQAELLKPLLDLHSLTRAV